jgi:hypothetical protein
MTIRLVLYFALLFIMGCAESATLRTEPPRAKVYIDGNFVGMSPAEFLIGRLEEGHYRVVLDGYEPSEGQLQARIAPGRVVGTVFTFGIYAIFRGLHYYPLTDVDLTPSPNRPPPVGGGPDRESSPADRLRNVQDMYDHGLINEQEYKRIRSDILRELAPTRQ